MDTLTNVKEWLDVFSGFENQISGIVEKFATLSIGATIIYTLLFLLFLTFIISIALNKFGFSDSSKRFILILFWILFIVGVAIQKYEVNSAYKLEVLKGQVLEEMAQRQESKSAYNTLTKSIAGCTIENLDDLTNEYSIIFRRSQEGSNYFINLKKSNTIDIIHEKAMEETNKYLLEHPQTSVVIFRETAERSNFVNIDSGFVNSFLRAYPQWMIDEDSVFVPRPIIENKEEQLKEDVSNEINLKGPKSSGY